MAILAKIQTGGPVGHVGSESWAVETICRFSALDIHPAEVQILRHVRGGDSPTGMRYVLSGGQIVGSYSLSEVDTMSFARSEWTQPHQE